MKVKKFLLGMTLTLGLGIFSAPTIEANALEKGQILTKEQISLKISEINNKYDMNEAISEEDQKFIKTYGDKLFLNEAPFQTATPMYTNQKTVAGIETKISGDIIYGQTPMILKSYTGRFITETFSGDATKITNNLHYGTYRLDPKEGMVKMTDGTLSTSCDNGKICEFSKTGVYAGDFALARGEAIVEYPGGSFSINLVENQGS
ncbi:hypothetical protein [Bacillus thuringiensis]|uniref:hypothetical protein n=1 Tax=Bacillus thuringiensis TaxID=1428 RepID=UPI000BEE4019|nr:hypothetical protein [Bacillus thuringiensis]PDY26983.1 hypothetical protein COM84_25065 [Bacillus thuringiensis]PGH92609.1 hypothetical protein CN898_26515 [Bacillus thuringiensis]